MYFVRRQHLCKKQLKKHVAVYVCVCVRVCVSEDALSSMRDIMICCQILRVSPFPHVVFETDDHWCPGCWQNEAC